MITVVSFLDRLAPGLYLLLVAAFIWNVWKARRTSKQYRAMYFELEREVTRLRRVNAITVLVVVALVGLTLLGIQKSVLPFLRQVQDIQTIQQEVALVMDGDFATSVPRNPEDAPLDIQAVGPLGGDDTPLIVATPAFTPTPVGTIVPNSPDTEGCTDPRATLRLPANGMRVFQPTTIEGTAYTDDFTQWKIELNGPGTQMQWVVRLENTQPVLTTQPFAQFSPADYASSPTTQGLYKMRLMVFDFTGQPVASCMINIYISPPPETPTPTPTPSA